LVVVLVNWLIIFGAALIFGFGVAGLFGKECRQSVGSLDLLLAAGLVALDVYAQVFSIFYKVGARACLALLVAGIVAIGFYYWRKSFSLKSMAAFLGKISAVQWGVAVICVLAAALLTAQSPGVYDTYLYHAQSIRWIEEYGVVPGMGNLHNRLAYNSAFMPLQALFSLKWLGGQSLHGMNGFLCCMFSVYALGSSHVVKKQPLQLCDFFKAAMAVYIWLNREVMSSPSSDILPMLLVLYICAKWSEFTEAGIREAEPYAFLGLLGVWAVTVKLSTMACALFAVYPFFVLVKEKRWKTVLGYMFSGAAAVAPWAVRNVIISGYLLYPYPQLDFFSFDWKMPESVLTCDSREIMVWGRGIKDVSLYDMPFREWIPIWFSGQSVFYQVLIVLGLAAAAGVVMLLLKGVGQKNKGLHNILLIFVLSGLAVWIFTAPLMRYGVVYLLLPVCIVFSAIFTQGRRGSQFFSWIFFLAFMAGGIWTAWQEFDRDNLVGQEDYEWRETAVVEWQGIQIAVPVGSDQCGYHAFPGTPYQQVLELIGLRGEDVGSGFRANEKYFEKRLNNSGREW